MSIVPVTEQAAEGRRARPVYSEQQRVWAVTTLNRGLTCRYVAHKLGPHCSPSTPIRWRQNVRRLEAANRDPSLPPLQYPPRRHQYYSQTQKAEAVNLYNSGESAEHVSASLVPRQCHPSTIFRWCREAKSAAESDPNQLLLPQ